MNKKAKISSEEKSKLIFSALEDKKAVDLVAIDVQARTLMTDCLIIATGTSRVHIKALADAVIEAVKKSGVKGKRIEGYDEAQWVLLDYEDVVAHIMTPEQREYYRLEAYWKGEEKGSPPIITVE